MNWLKDKWIDFVIWYEHRQHQPMNTRQALTFFFVVHLLILVPSLILLWQKYAK